MEAGVLDDHLLNCSTVEFLQHFNTQVLRQVAALGEARLCTAARTRPVRLRPERPARRVKDVELVELSDSEDGQAHSSHSSPIQDHDYVAFEPPAEPQGSARPSAQPAVHPALVDRTSTSDSPALTRLPDLLPSSSDAPAPAGPELQSLAGLPSAHRPEPVTNVAGRSLPAQESPINPPFMPRQAFHPPGAGQPSPHGAQAGPSSVSPEVLAVVSGAGASHGQVQPQPAPRRQWVMPSQAPMQAGLMPLYLPPQAPRVAVGPGQSPVAAWLHVLAARWAARRQRPSAHCGAVVFLASLSETAEELAHLFNFLLCTLCQHRLNICRKEQLYMDLMAHYSLHFPNLVPQQFRQAPNGALIGTMLRFEELFSPLRDDTQLS